MQWMELQQENEIHQMEHTEQKQQTEPTKSKMKCHVVDWSKCCHDTQEGFRLKVISHTSRSLLEMEQERLRKVQQSSASHSQQW